MMSRTSLTYSGVREATMYSNLVFWALRTKLCLYLSKPDLWVGRPVRRELEVDGGDLACVGIHGHGECVGGSRRGHQYRRSRDKTNITDTPLHLYIQDPRANTERFIKVQSTNVRASRYTGLTQHDLLYTSKF